MYHVMTCEGIYPRTSIGKPPEVPCSPWNDGQPITEPIEEPIIYTLDPDYPGSMLPMYDIAETLMRFDLIASLSRAGVDNMQMFQAIIRDAKEGKECNDYKAVNIIGVIAAADMQISVPMGTSDSVLIDMGFDSLVIDEKKPHGALIFRLAESVNAIVVHEKVKQQIEADGIPGMTFYGPGEWAG